jgi:hypothetical protein
MDKITELFDLFGESAYCSICLENISEGSRVRLLNECNHIFHNICIDKWFLEKSSCPTCRKEYTLIIPKSNDSEIMSDIDRLFMTWTLLHGILKKIKLATVFNEKKNDIRLVFARFRSLPVDLDTRYSLASTKQYIAARICKIQNLHKTQVHRQPQVYQWIDKIESHSEYRNLIQHIWLP